MGFISEFKEFAMKGNVLDMAVGVIIGGAFGKIVTSLVNDVLMPVISLATGGIDFTNLFISKKSCLKGTFFGFRAQSYKKILIFAQIFIIN